jgi:hypothetical protein
MPNFYLNIRDGDELIRDPHVYDFPTAQAARDAAIRTVQAIIESNPNGHGFEYRQVAIADGTTGLIISIVWFHDVAPHHLN